MVKELHISKDTILKQVDELHEKVSKERFNDAYHLAFEIERYLNMLR